MQEMAFEQFQQVGKDLMDQGLISSHGGNLSMRLHGRLLITAHFTMLGSLEPSDIVEIPLREETDHVISDASKDAALHQLIYKFTPAGAVIHAHPAYAIALSLDHDVIDPRDLEGQVLLRQVPVIAAEKVEQEAPQLLQTHSTVMVHGHGSYAVGRTLNEALAFTSALALSSKITWLAMTRGDSDS